MLSGGTELSRQPRLGAAVCGTTAAGTSPEKFGWVVGRQVNRSLPLKEESVVARTLRVFLWVCGQEHSQRPVLEPPVGHDVRVHVRPGPSSG